MGTKKQQISLDEAVSEASRLLDKLVDKRLQNKNWFVDEATEISKKLVSQLRVLELIRMGLSPTVIAKRVGVSPTTVLRWRDADHAPKSHHAGKLVLLYRKMRRYAQKSTD